MKILKIEGEDKVIFEGGMLKITRFNDEPSKK